MRSVLEADIQAPAELVFGLVRDVERWPRLLPHYVRANVLATSPDGPWTVEFVARRPLVSLLGLGLPVAWRSRTWNDPTALTLRFVHQGGATDGMDVTWRIAPSDGGSTVSIEHLFSRWGELYPRLVERLFVRPIAARTLSTFKALAEALAAESADPSPTNPST